MSNSQKERLYHVMLNESEIQDVRRVARAGGLADVVEALDRAIEDRKKRDKDATWESLRQTAFQRERERRARGAASEYPLPEDRDRL